MIYDMRMYEAHPGKELALRERFLRDTVRIFKRLGIEVVHVFAPQDDASALWYITRFSDEEARKRMLDAFSNDQEWAQIKKETEQDGPLLKSQKATLLNSLYSAST